MNRDYDLGSLIKSIANAKDTIENRKLKKYSLTASQMHILLHLYDAKDHRKPLKQLEKDLDVSQSTMAKMVRNLAEEKHLVQYETDAHDKRIKNIVLTKDAIPICLSASHIVDEMETILKADLNDDEVEQLRNYLVRMYDAMKEGV